MVRISRSILDLQVRLGEAKSLKTLRPRTTKVRNVRPLCRTQGFTLNLC